MMYLNLDSCKHFWSIVLLAKMNRFTKNLVKVHSFYSLVEISIWTFFLKLDFSLKDYYFSIAGAWWVLISEVLNLFHWPFPLFQLHFLWFMPLLEITHKFLQIIFLKSMTDKNSNKCIVQCFTLDLTKMKKMFRNLDSASNSIYLVLLICVLTQ